MTLRQIRETADQALKALNAHDYDTASALMLTIRTEIDTELFTKRATTK